VEDAKPIRHLYVGQIPGAELVLKLTDPNATLLKDQRLSNIVEVVKTKDLPPMGTTLADRPLEEPPCISSDQSRGGGVSWNNPYRERTSPPATLERHKVNPEEGDDAKSNPKEVDDAKSNALPQPDFDGADLVLTLIDQYATLLKGQHSPSLAEMAEMENLPYQEGIGPLMHAPVGTNPNIPYLYDHDIRRILSLHLSSRCTIQRWLKCSNRK